MQNTEHQNWDTAHSKDNIHPTVWQYRQRSFQIRSKTSVLPEVCNLLRLLFVKSDFHNKEILTIKIAIEVISENANELCTLEYLKFSVRACFELEL